MINIISFYRKKTTKIYLIILTILMLSVIILHSFINYYSNIGDNLFSKRSILIVQSENDHYQDIIKYKEIKNIKKILTFSPNKSYDTIVDAGYSVTDSQGNIIDSYLPDIKETQVTWQPLNISNFENNLLVGPDSNQQIKLTDKEMALGVPESYLNESNMDFKSLIGKKIGFYYNEKPIEFTISYVYETEWPEITISEKLYKNLNKENNFYTYRAIITSLEKSSQIKKELLKLENSDNIKVIIESTFYNEEGQIIENIYSILSTLTLLNYLVISIFLIIFLIVLKNIVNDLQENIIFKRKIGFTKKEIKKQIVLNLIILHISTFILGILISYIFIFLINYIWNLNLRIINYEILSFLFFIVISMDFLIVIFKKIKSA